MSIRCTSYAAYAIQDGVPGHPEILLGRFTKLADAKFACNGIRQTRILEESFEFFESIKDYNRRHREKMVASALAKLDANEQAYLKEHWIASKE